MKLNESTFEGSQFVVYFTNTHLILMNILNNNNH